MTSRAPKQGLDSLRREVRLLRRRLDHEKRARLESEQASQGGLRELYRQQQEMELLRQIATMANESTNLRRTLRRCLQLVARHLACRMASSWLNVDSQKPSRWQNLGTWHERQAGDTSPSYCSDELHTMNDLVGADALQDRRPHIIVLADLILRSRVSRQVLASKQQVNEAIAVPVTLDDGSPVALLEFYFESIGPNATRFIELCRFISDQIATVFERISLTTQLKEARRKLENEVLDQSREIGRLAGQCHHTEEKFRLMVANLGEVVFQADHRGRVTFLNEYWQQLCGCAQEACIDKPLADLVAPEDANVMEDLVRQVIADDHSIKNATFLIPHRDGSGRWVQMNARKLKHPVDQSVTIVGTFVDVTDRRRSEEELRQANRKLEKAAKMKDEFLASMSHELRTPLNSVLGFAEVLSEQLLGPLNQKQQQSIGNIRKSGAHLLSLINDILDLSKIEAGHEDLDRQTLIISDLAEGCLAMVRKAAQSKSQKLSLSNDSGEAVMTADRQRMIQILVNLLNNAIKFTPSGGSIDLACGIEEQTDSVVFMISDTGIGISQRDQKQLFKPFVQIDSSLSRQYSGTGLGLCLAKQLTELHDGEIGLTSSPEKGSCFTVRIPRRPTGSIDEDWGQPAGNAGLTPSHDFRPALGGVPAHPIQSVRQATPGSLLSPS